MTHTQMLVAVKIPLEPKKSSEDGQALEEEPQSHRSAGSGAADDRERGGAKEKMGRAYGARETDPQEVLLAPVRKEGA